MAAAARNKTGLGTGVGTGQDERLGTGVGTVVGTGVETDEKGEIVRILEEAKKRYINEPKTVRKT